MTKMKLCGMTRLADIEIINEIKPEYIGFVFWPKSKRNVSAETAKKLRSKLEPSVKAVGVFVDEDVKNIAQLYQEGIIDIAQLHGSETEEDIRNLRDLCDVKIIKAFTIKEESDIDRANSSIADFVLVDSGKGSGRTFAWQLLARMQRPFFLAGGLGLDNVREAIETLLPYGVDVSSGIETDGRKDPEKMIRFARLVREE